MDFVYPVLGLDENFGFHSQRDLTTKEATNVRGIDPKTGRVRGAQRSGQTKYNTALLSGANKVDHLTSFILDSNLTTYQDKTTDPGSDDETTYDEVWSAKLPNFGEPNHVIADRQSNVWVTDGENGLVKYSPDGEEVFTFKFPSKAGTDVVTALEIDDFDFVFAGTSAGNKVENARLWKYRQIQRSPVEKDPCEKDTEKPLEQDWEIEPQGNVEEIVVKNGLLHVLINDPRANRAFVVIYDFIDSASPRRISRREVPAPAYGMDVRKDGAIFVASGPNLNRGFDPRVPGFKQQVINWTPDLLEGASQRVWAWMRPEELAVDYENGDEITRWRDNSGHDRDLFPLDFPNGPRFDSVGIAGRGSAHFDGVIQALVSGGNPDSGWEFRDQHKSLLPTWIHPDAPAAPGASGERPGYYSRFCLFIVARVPQEANGRVLLSQPGTVLSSGAAGNDFEIRTNSDHNSAVRLGDVHVRFTSSDAGGAIFHGGPLGGGSRRMPKSPGLAPAVAFAGTPPPVFNATGDGSYSNDTRTILLTVVHNGADGATTAPDSDGTFSHYRVNGIPMDVGTSEPIYGTLPTFVGTNLLGNVTHFQGDISEIIVLADWNDEDGVLQAPHGRDLQPGTTFLYFNDYPQGDYNPGFPEKTFDIMLTEGYLLWKFGIHDLPQQPPFVALGEFPHPYATEEGAPKDPDLSFSQPEELNSTHGILSKWDQTGDRVKWALTSSSQSGDSIGGVGYDVKVGCNEDVFSMGPRDTETFRIDWFAAGALAGGTPLVGDMLVQDISNATGTLVAWDASTPGFVELTNVTGTFVIDAVIRAQAPATYTIVDGVGGVGVGQFAFSAGTGGSSSVIRKVIDKGDTYSLESADTAWDESYENAGDELDYKRPKIDVDKYSNVYYPGHTLAPTVAGDNNTFYARSKTGTLLHQVQIEDTDDNDRRRAQAIAHDRAIPIFQGDLLDDGSNDCARAEYLYVATSGRNVEDITALTYTPATNSTNPLLIGASGHFDNFDPFNGATFKATGGLNITTPQDAVVVSKKVSDTTIELVQDLQVSGAAPHTAVTGTLTLNPSRNTTLHKARLVNAVPSAGSTREVINLGVSNTDVVTYDDASTVTSVATGAFPNTGRFFQSALVRGKLVIANGDLYKVFQKNPDTYVNELVELKAKQGGIIPPRGKLLASWRGRLVIARFADEPQNYKMSSALDLFDWNEFPPFPLTTSAVSGNTPNRAGLVPDIITTLIPYTDDVLIFGCDSSIHMLSGDPMNGGQIDLVSEITGMAVGSPWTKDAQGRVYFFGQKGGLWGMVPGGVPERISVLRIERRLQDIDLSLYKIELTWNYRDEALHVWVLPFTTATEVVSHFVWEQKTGGWCEDKIGTSSYLGIQPTAITVVDGDDPDDRFMLLGGGDGYVRKWDEDAANDDVDGSAASIPIESSVIFGPYSLGPEIQARFSGLRGTLAHDQDGCHWEFFASDDAMEEGDPKADGEWMPGYNERESVRVRGAFGWFRLFNNKPDERWAFEEASIQVQPAGRRRRTRV